VIVSADMSVWYGEGSISSTFYARQYSCAKKLQSQNVTREKLCKALLYQKFVRKMLMKLTAGGNKCPAEMAQALVLFKSKINFRSFWPDFAILGLKFNLEFRFIEKEYHLVI
jgi:hypothetical protein